MLFQKQFWVYFGGNVGLCIAGLLGYGLYSVRNHMRDFDWNIFWNHNRTFWVWAILCQLLFAFVMALVPELEDWFAGKLIQIMDAAAGQTLGIPENLVETVVYLTATWHLSRIANMSVKDDKKIGHRKI